MATPLRLAGDRASGYAAVARHLLAVARPGAHYSDGRRLDAHLSFLVDAGQPPGTLDVDPRTGLPTLRQLLRVTADADLARRELADEPADSPRRRYWEALAAAEVMRPSTVDVRLRVRASGRVRLEVVHDRIDAASGLFLRYTALVEVRGTRQVAMSRDELPEPTQAFLNLMERNSGADAELALLLLSDLPGVTVEEVVRGQIGPLHFAGIDVPQLLTPVVRDCPGAFILHLALERAGIAVSEDRCRDPLASLYRHRLSARARPAIDARAAALGYHVAKERRLVCTPSAEPALRSTLARAGARVVVRSA